MTGSGPTTDKPTLGHPRAGPQEGLRADSVHQEYAAELRAQVKEVKTRPPWSYGKTPEWASQSYRLALSHAYAIPKDGKLGQAYFDRNVPIVNERLRQAGVHVAETLNDVFTMLP